MNRFAFVKYHLQKISGLYLQKWRFFSKISANFATTILLRYTDFINYKLK